ncbi:hypothetical protein BLNAU_23798 [Blattamonas nauphoetae]|uniref:Uncharacterized protein n=1 Tax=Blattamonas nauphoetae TaxID=2049346 RepID=A0ABQ9WTC7_9EUKA|nr:hypothetical protein BLNAU_23798 [Blattamonas nauphoetae]
MNHHHRFLTHSLSPLSTSARKSHPFKLFICKHHLSPRSERKTMFTYSICVLSNTRKSSNLSEVAISCKSNESAVALITSGGQTHRTLQERRIANSSTKPGSLSASLSLVEGLLQKDGQKYNQTGFKVRGERVEDMLAEDTLTVAVTTEPALVCDLSFEVDTGTQKTWKSWN